MRISEAAAASGCHLETIRYYERSGMLPKAARRKNGYREYTTREVDRLRFITRGRELGFSLEEIQSLLRLADQSAMSCAEVDHLARHHLAAIRERVRELNRMARDLERTIVSCAGGSRGDCKILEALSGTARPAERR